MKSISRNFSITIICIILGIMLSWQYKSIQNNKKATSAQTGTLQSLQEELIGEKTKNENLRTRNQELERRVSEYISAEGSSKKIEEGLKEEIQRSKILAGLADVEGPGAEIVLNDGEIFSVTDTSLMGLINEIKAAEAQAISINGERVVAMTEIKMTNTRVIPHTIVVNGRQMQAPFIIKAIADPDKLNNSLNMLEGITDRYINIYGLDVTVKKMEQITIPKVSDDGSVLKYNLLEPL
ncbi:MAG: DUF881 domain-containing protein [Clostridium sp.]|nr:DUF881 domain-containing protein [Clostridium sp.]